MPGSLKRAEVSISDTLNMATAQTRPSMCMVLVHELENYISNFDTFETWQHTVGIQLGHS